MTPKVSLRMCAAGVAGVLLFPVAARAQLNADELKAFGGIYSAACANPSAPRVRVAADALMVEQGTQRMTGRAIQAAHSYFGQSPPENFIVALLSEVRPGFELMGFVYSDRAGPYLQLDAVPKVKAALGQTLMATRFRDCDQARVQRVMAQRSVGAAEFKRNQSEGNRGAMGRFKRSYLQSLGTLAKQYWLTNFEIPWMPDQPIKVGGVDYLLGRQCKPHDCYDNNMVVIYSQTENIVYGKANIANRPSYFGAPPPAMQRELDRRWLSEFRQNR